MSSSTSSNPGRTSYGYQDPGKSVAGDDRSGKSEKTSWNMMQQVAPHREKPLLDGNAHSVRYEERKPEKVNSQEGQIPKLSSWEVTQQNLRIK